LAAPLTSSHRAPGRLARIPPRDPDQAGDHRKSLRANPPASGDHSGCAIFPPLGYGSSAAEMVVIGTIAMAALRPIEFRIVPGPAELSVPGRAICPPANAGLGLVRLLWCIRDPVRSGSVASWAGDLVACLGSGFLSPNPLDDSLLAGTLRR